MLPWYVNERMKEREKGMVEELQVCSLVIDMQSQWEHMMAMQTGPNCWALGSVLGDQNKRVQPCRGSSVPPHSSSFRHRHWASAHNLDSPPVTVTTSQPCPHALFMAQMNLTSSWVATAQQAIQSCVVGPRTQQQPCAPTGATNHQVCHWNSNPVQLLLPTANPPSNAFCGFTLASIRLNNISITSGVTSEHLLLGLETTFWCHLGPPKGPLRSFSPPTTPNLDLCH